jgi:outer membrane protein assembly factor BamB
VHLSEHRGASGSTYALDARSGALVWQRTGAETRVTVAAGQAFHGHLDPAAGVGVFSAFDARTGRERWQYTFSFETPAHMTSRQLQPRLSDATATAGRIYFGCLNELHCLDIHTGQRLWRWRLTGRILQRPTLAGDTLFVATTGRLYALAVQ